MFNIVCYCLRVFRLVIEIFIIKVKELIRIKYEIFMIMRGLMSCIILYIVIKYYVRLVLGFRFVYIKLRI